MPRILTMGTLVGRFKQRANMVGDDSIDVPEWKAYGSEIYGELYEEVAGTGLRYFEYETSFTTTGAGYLAEPTDMLSMVDSLEILDASGRYRRLRAIMPQERSIYAGRTGDPTRFEVVDDRFYLYPAPPADKTIALRYVAQSPDLSAYADADAVDVVTAAGEAFLIWGVAAIAKAKDERFVDFAETQKEKARVRLVNWAVNRLMNEPTRTVVDEDDDMDLRSEGTYR